MQAYKLKGRINQTGQLIITEPVDIPAGEVEVIVLQSTAAKENDTALKTESQDGKPKRRTQIKALEDWFEKTQPAPLDFDPDQAKWEYLKEKHNL